MVKTLVVVAASTMLVTLTACAKDAPAAGAGDGPLAPFKTCLESHGVHLDKGTLRDALASGATSVPIPSGITTTDFDSAMTACADRLPDEVDPSMLGIAPASSSPPR